MNHKEPTMKTTAFGWMATVLAAAALLGATAAWAEDEASEAPELGRWTLSAGAAWRSQVKLELSGTATQVPLRSSRQASAEDPRNSSDWHLETVPSPIASDPDPVWSTANVREEVLTRGGGREISLAADEEESLTGVELRLGVDLWRSGTFSAGLGLLAAGFPESEVSCTGTLAASQTRRKTYADHYYFLDDLWTGDASADLDWAADGSKPQSSPYRSEQTGDTGWKSAGDGRTVTARLRSELYQVGAGPRVRWDALPWLGLYAEVDALLNFVKAELEADGASESGTAALPGVGGYAGLELRAADWCGLFGHVGYEWVDRRDISVGGFRGEVDYSSLTGAAGVVLRF